MQATFMHFWTNVKIRKKMLEQNMRKAIEDLAELKESAVKFKADVAAAQRNYDGAVRKMQAEHGFAVSEICPLI